MLVDVKERLKEADIQMTFDVSVKDMLGKEGYDEKSGARPLRRTISKRIEDPLSEDLLLGRIPLNTPLVLKAREDSSIYFEPAEETTETGEVDAEPEKEPVESAS
jgi:ATP-dependent Clp protease ATP-binding subunit ClpC